MRVNICWGAILIQDLHSCHSAPRSRIAGIYSYSGISQTNVPIIIAGDGLLTYLMAEPAVLCLISISFSFPVGFIEEFALSVLGFLRVGHV